MVSKEDKIGILDSLKVYHDVLVKINNTTDLVKEYKLHFNEGTNLIEELLGCFTKDESREMNIRSEIIFEKGKIKKNNSVALDYTSIDENTPGSLKNRKRNIEPVKEKEASITRDISQEYNPLIEMILKENYVFDYAKSKKRKVLLGKIKDSYTDLMLNDINQLLELKKNILEK